jgi:uncharacterized membrane protein
MLPLLELRVGLPFAISYAVKNNIPIFPVSLLIILSNILVIFFVFYFLDNLNKRCMKNKVYTKIFNFYLRKMQNKIDKFEKKYSILGFIGLLIFVSVPLPGTGAWSGVFISWILDLDRKKSILSIAGGVLIAGVLILLTTLGFFYY